MIRTYAMWDKHGGVFWCFIGIVTCCFAPCVVGLVIQLRSQFVGPVNQDCLIQSSNVPNFLYIPVLVSETVIAWLTFFKGVEHLHRSSHLFLKKFYVSGMFFYAFFLLITLANMLLPCGPTMSHPSSPLSIQV
ncbi:hypothetical protein IW262DRAFT_1066043 [Armillaria fumosa]|nr:hypothetical protein IW262DRAFT_1066043 [Armillaria fumosa]